MDLTTYFYNDCSRIIVNYSKNPNFNIDPGNLPQDHTLKWNTLTDENGPITIYPHPISGNLGMHRHDFFELAYVYRGKCRMCVDASSIEMRAGDLCLLNLQARHTIEVGDIKDNIIFNILAAPAFFNSIYFRLAYLPSSDYLFDFFLKSMENQRIKDNFVLFHNTGNNSYMALIEQVIYESYGGKFQKNEMLGFLFSSLLIELARTYGNSLDVSSRLELKKYRITEITDYIYEHYDTITLKDLAEHFSYSCAYLSTVIKKFSGCSFSELLHTFRFVKACQLLTETDKSISEVIALIGCSNSTWFTKKFKERYTLSPSEYRRKYKTEFRENSIKI